MIGMTFVTRLVNFVVPKITKGRENEGYCTLFERSLDLRTKPRQEAAPLSCSLAFRITVLRDSNGARQCLQ